MIAPGCALESQTGEPVRSPKNISDHIQIARMRRSQARVAELMMIKFGESGHPVFRATSPFSRGTLKSKGGGKLSIHFCADWDTIETVFRTIISVNQLSIYGAVSDLCEEYSSCTSGSSRKSLRMQEENWKHQWLQPCLARLARRVSMERPVVRPMIFKSKFCVYLGSQ